MTTLAPPSHRSDRAELRAPVRLDTGAWRVEAVAAEPAVHRYPWGAEYVPAETLQDPEYLEAHAGLPVLLRDGLHPDRDVTSADLAGSRRIGTMLAARYDAGIGQVVSMVIDHEADVEAARQRYRWVSLGYDADTDPTPGVTPDGVRFDAIQRRRRTPNHIVLTDRPRAGSAASIRLDAEGGSMDEALKAALDAIASGLAEIKSMLAKPEAEAEAEAESPRMDSAADWRPLLATAGRLGVEVPDGATLADARKVVAAKIPGRTDSIDDGALIAVFHGMQATQASATEASRFAAETRRTDSTGGRKSVLDQMGA